MTAKSDGADEAFLKTLEEGVRAVLTDKKSKPHERVAAISAGAKLLAIKHKIKDDDSTGFFG